MAIHSVIALRALFSTLGCVMVAIVVYTISVDGLPFRRELLTPWMAATLVDYYINVAVLAAWVLYKEVKWMNDVLWLVLLVCLGSIATCAYIVLQTIKLPSQESLQDTMYHILMQHENKDNMEKRRNYCSVVCARILFSALACFMFGTLLYTCVNDGSPFRKELLTPWMSATLVDFYINVVALSVWVGYKETHRLKALFWIIMLICFGSISTCAYVVWQLLLLAPQDPPYLILLKYSNRGFVAVHGRN